MAKIAQMSLTRFKDDSLAGGAASFELIKAPKQSLLKSSLNEGWEAEVCGDLPRITVRFTQPLLRDELLDAAIVRSQQFLDFLSVQAREHLVIRNAVDVCILMFIRGGRRILHHRDVSDMGISLKASATVIRRGGTVVEPQSVLEPSWTPAFRYYRLSQTSDDLYESYRNMYLAFESTLSELFPKRNGEGEKTWLHRALLGVEQSGDFAWFTPAASRSLADYFMNEQYETVRCKIFHSKLGAQNLLPQESPAHARVLQAYEQLASLWEGVARKRYAARLPSGGMSYFGFKSMCDGVFSKIKFWLTEDSAPFDKEDNAISPNGLPLFPFEVNQYLGEQSPGRVAHIASVPVSSFPPKQIVGRVGATLDTDDKALLVSQLLGGLDLDEADEFESVHVTQLVNRDAPRAKFS